MTLGQKILQIVESISHSMGVMEHRLEEIEERLHKLETISRSLAEVWDLSFEQELMQPASDNQDSDSSTGPEDSGPIDSVLAMLGQRGRKEVSTEELIDIVRRIRPSDWVPSFVQTHPDGYSARGWSRIHALVIYDSGRRLLLVRPTSKSDRWSVSSTTRSRWLRDLTFQELPKDAQQIYEPLMEKIHGSKSR